MGGHKGARRKKHEDAARQTKNYDTATSEKRGHVKHVEVWLFLLWSSLRPQLRPLLFLLLPEVLRISLI
jgi:hypothetical protein